MEHIPHPSFAVIPAAQAALVKHISLWLADVVGPNTLTRRQGRGLRRVLACFSSCFDPASTIHNPCPISGCKGVCTSSLGFLLCPRSLCVLLRPISCNDGPTTLQGSGCGSKRKDSQLAGCCSPAAVVAVSIAAPAGSSAIAVAWSSGFPMLLVKCLFSAPPTRDARDGRKGAEDLRGDLPPPPGERETQNLLRRPSIPDGDQHAS